MKTLIEIGAFDGTDSLRFHSQGYRVFTFEPKKDLYENLIHKTKHLENYTVTPKAVCLDNGTTIFHICKEGGASSILPFRCNKKLVKTWTAKRTDIHYSGKSYEVETIRLDTFIEQNSLENDIIDYIHIDAQGVDLDCLKSLGKYLVNVQEGVLETVMNKEKSIYRNQDSNIYENVKEFLESNGFKITKIESNDKTACEYNIYFTRM
jgi:FkbM family methyltransferase